MAASLREVKPAHTVRLYVANKPRIEAIGEARAARIRAAKAAMPRGWTWRRIADAVGVTERSITYWAKTGRLERENCDRLAEVLMVDPTEALWGDEPADESADSYAEQLKRIENRLHDLISAIENAGLPVPELQRAAEDFAQDVEEASQGLDAQDRLGESSGDGD